MEPIILHSDMNNFYASVEMLYDPALRERPVAVAGDEEARHGIVLAKNELAKKFGVHTGQVLWEARQQCPGLVCVPAHYDRYLHFSALARDIYISYTDQVEAFGLDECWIDVTGSTRLFGDGITIANEIRSRIRQELGLTVSVGVSYNKVFAKLGSDMKKPDATTVITPENYQEICSMWVPLPLENLPGLAFIPSARWPRQTLIFCTPCLGRMVSCCIDLPMDRIAPVFADTMQYLL